MAVNANPVSKDSIIITFGEKTRLIIYGEDRQELEKLLKYDLNALLRDLEARLDTIEGDTKIYYDELDGRDYLKDKSDADKDKNYVRIGLRGIRIKDGDTEVNITSRGVDIKDGGERVKIGSVEKDSTEEDDDDDHVTRIRKVNRYSSPRKGFNVNVGLNAYGDNQPMGYNTSDYDLRPFGSRYISLGLVRSATIARGNSVGLHMDFGLNASWYNLMFDGSNTVEKTATGVAFVPLMDRDNRELELSKSKLTVPYINFSLMPTLSFPKSAISYISAGVYGGYRLGGYTKTKTAGTGEKDHVRTNYYLDDFRYGAAFELGIRNFPDLFVNYDFNTLFEDNRGPAVRMISFGIRL
ncbi:outer membrane beta-barrel protein [Telluribacter humicola]|uniref:outer membrane beta-barrel protein n=1 Tax=Telluribacter humicola TaxID=1720261 RepID=UPI001E293985|nr:outer membrane beta-barrel protein [Telluribacter humicola]